MALRFNCSACEQDILVQFLKIGEVTVYKNCGEDNTVPESSEQRIWTHNTLESRSGACTC